MASLQRIRLPVGGIGCFDEKLLGRRPVAGLIDKSDVEKNGPVGRSRWQFRWKERRWSRCYN